MKLREWREINRKTLKECAALFDATDAMVSKWERGTRIPRRPQMLRVYLATERAVDPNSFYDLPALAEAAA